MRSLRALVLGVVWLVTSAASARAEGFMVPYVGFNKGDTPACAPPTVCESRGRSYGVSLGSMGTGFGSEQDISYTKDLFGKVPGAENSVLMLMSNALAGAGSGRVQPYVLFGFGLIRLHTSVTAGNVVTKYDKNAFGWNIGAGVSGYFTRGVGLRGDVRRFRTFSGAPYPGNETAAEKLKFWRASLGLIFRF